MLLRVSSKSSLRVYAVWFPMYPGDARDRWNPSLLNDPRVVHYWDEQRTIGRTYLQNVARLWAKRAAGTVPPQEEAVWDAFLLYGPRARWEEQLPDVVSWGAPILATRDVLERRLTQTVKN
jgi:hypothetical protein